MKNLKIENYFLFFILFYGVIYIFITPPFYVSDEMGHFNKAASKELIFFNKDLKISKSARKFSEDKKFNYYYYKNLKDYKFKKNDIINLKEKFLWDEKYVDASLQALKNYPITGYWPQKLGINISKLFSDKILYSFYTGRIFNLLFCSLIIFACLKKIKREKELIICVLFFPMTISILASFNQDALFISYIIVIFTIIFNQNKNLNYSIKFFLPLLIAFIVIITKPPYIFILPIIFYYLSKNFKTNSKLYLYLFLIIYSSLLIYIIYNTEQDENIIINRNLQIEFLKDNIFIYTKVIFNDLSIHYSKYIMGVIGHLGHNDILLSKYLYYAFIAVFFTLLTLSVLSLSNFNKIDIFVVFLFCFIGLLFLQFSFYLHFTYPGNEKFVQGLIGRYIIPIICLFCLFFTNISCAKYINIKKNLIIIIPHLNIFALYEIYNFFYLY